jgi:membrane protease YdiL (CAAX protease family)
MTEKILEKESKPVLPVWARIVLVIISYSILVGIFQIIGMLIAKIPLTGLSALKDISIKQQLILQLFGFLPLILIVYTFRKFIDKKSIKSIGFSLKNRFAEIVAGFIIALFIIGGGSLILYAFNYVEFLNIRIDIYSLLLGFLLFIIISLNEEIFFRGYILNNLMSSMNKYLALIISAIIFSLFHSLNFNLSLIAMINLLLAGIILGSTYIFTKNLWFPISLHLFWNFFQGPILGYSVSGQKSESVFTINLLGNSSINGGNFGFEGSIVCIIMLVLAIVMIMSYNIRNSLKQKLTTANRVDGPASQS